MAPHSPVAAASREAPTPSPDHRLAHDQTAEPQKKRKSLLAGNDSAADAAVDATDAGKKKRRKVNHACVYCRRSHMTCDLERPCARCVKRDIGHLCHDEFPTAKKSKGDGSVAELAPVPDNAIKDGSRVLDIDHAVYSNGDADMAPRDEPSTNIGNEGDLPRPHIAQPTPLSPAHLRRNPQPDLSTSLVGLPQPSFDWSNSSVQNQFQDMHHLHPNYMFNNAEVNSEYNLLNDFLSTSLLDDGALFENDDAQALLQDPLLATSSMNALSASLQVPGSGLSQPPPQTSTAKAGQEISRPSSAFPSSEQSRNKFYMTAADPAGLSSAEDRLHKLLKAKYDAGMLKPFNYVRGYARLNAYMSAHLTQRGALRIRRQLDRFRPKFREAMQGLSDMQLVLVEMWFERSLMEYDRVFAAMAIPACCWRRTGEIFRGNREMAELVGVSWEQLRDGRLAIHEIIAEESLVSYWEKFGAIAFDQSQKAILTSCTLSRVRADVTGQKGQRTTGDGAELVKCCFSFTIRRDTHNIPSLIIGNFIPIKPRELR